ncbi:hypothetical protein [Mesorhizobium sp. CAU 1741]|uniref:hypothetical protein n=1 Tax=Mesorhizobium sp. CAU 1741 TaxID=3140366 RepID=UPI00325C05DE
MTAVNAFIGRDRAFMLTDASMYTAYGTVMAFGQKAVAIPNLRAVIASRGVQKTTAILAMELSLMQSFDALLERAEYILPDYHQKHLMELSAAGGQDINIVVVGWSDEANAPLGFCFDSTTETFEMIDGYVAGPVPSDEENYNLLSIGCRPQRDVPVAIFDPVEHGIPYMEAQRRMKIQVSDICEPMSIVGGHVLLSEVTRDGVSQRVIHRWDDEPGEPIEPEPFHGSAPLERTLNRAERRRLGIAAKKKAHAR